MMNSDLENVKSSRCEGNHGHFKLFWESRRRWRYSCAMGNSSREIISIITTTTATNTNGTTAITALVLLLLMYWCCNLLTYLLHGTTAFLKELGHPLMRIYLSNSTLLNLLSNRGRVMGDESIFSHPDRK